MGRHTQSRHLPVHLNRDVTLDFPSFQTLQKSWLNQQLEVYFYSSWAEEPNSWKQVGKLIQPLFAKRENNTLNLP